MNHRVNQTLMIGLWGLLNTPGLAAERQPLWEAGMGGVMINFPDYRGSQSQQNYLLPLPFLIYRGERLRVNRQGLQGLLYQSDRVNLDVSVDGTVPVKSDPHGSRQDMPNLAPVFEIGPSLHFELAKHLAQGWKLSGRLPFRLAYAIDGLHADYAGWLINPQLGLDYTIHPQWKVGIVLGPLYANRDYHNYYYGVGSEFSTTTRSPYMANRGYSGIRLALATHWDFQKFRIGAFLRYDNLQGVTFEHSPLLEQPSALMMGIGIVWIFAQSPRMVETMNNE